VTDGPTILQASPVGIPSGAIGRSVSTRRYQFIGCEAATTILLVATPGRCARSSISVASRTTLDLARQCHQRGRHDVRCTNPEALFQ